MHVLVMVVQDGGDPAVDASPRDIVYTMPADQAANGAGARQLAQTNLRCAAWAHHVSCHPTSCPLTITSVIRLLMKLTSQSGSISDHVTVLDYLDECTLRARLHAFVTESERQTAQALHSCL